MRKVKCCFSRDNKPDLYSYIEFDNSASDFEIDTYCYDFIDMNFKGEEVDFSWVSNDN